jgi:hypothetical protein
LKRRWYFAGQFKLDEKQIVAGKHKQLVRPAGVAERAFGVLLFVFTAAVAGIFAASGFELGFGAELA